MWGGGGEVSNQTPLWECFLEQYSNSLNTYFFKNLQNYAKVISYFHLDSNDN